MASEPRAERIVADWRDLRACGDGPIRAALAIPRCRFDAWWDGHPWHERLWDLQHVKEMWWSPNINLHLTRRNPLLYIVLLRGEK